MKWKRIKGYKNYLLNEAGDLYNVKTDKFLNGYTNNSGTKYVALHKNGEAKIVQLSTVVLETFQPSQTVYKLYAFHKDLELLNCSNENLMRVTRSDRKRMFNEMSNKKRGVYKFNHGKKNWRVAFKDKQGKYKTIGYYKTEFFAKFNYIKAYTKEFGRPPY